MMQLMFRLETIKIPQPGFYAFLVLLSVLLLFGKNRFRDIIDGFFFTNKQDFQVILEEFSSVVKKSLDREEILSALMMAITEAFHAKTTIVCLPEPGSKRMRRFLVSGEGSDFIEGEGSPVWLDEVEQSNSQKKRLDRVSKRLPYRCSDSISFQLYPIRFPRL